MEGRHGRLRKRQPGGKCFKSGGSFFCLSENVFNRGAVFCLSENVFNLGAVFCLSENISGPGSIFDNQPWEQDTNQGQVWPLGQLD